MKDKDISYYVERIGPYIIPIPILCAFIYLIVIDDIKRLTEAFTIYATIDTIIIGFTGTIVSVMMSLKYDSDLVKEILKDNRFKSYVNECLVIGFIGAILTLLVIMLYEIENYKKITDIFIYISVYFVLTTFTTFYRFFKICMYLLFWEDETHEEKFKKPDQDLECREMFKSE